MNSNRTENKVKKGMLKKLRQERNHYITVAKSKVKEQSRVIQKIRKELKNGGRTVPEIAAATEISTSDVLWYLMALKKYGLIIEGEKEDGYFKYHQVSNEQ